MKKDLSTIDWLKIDKSKAIVERRSSDVTLEKMHAGDRRENETIGAALKKYQTLPPKIALESLVSFISYKTGSSSCGIIITSDNGRNANVLIL